MRWTLVVTAVGLLLMGFLYGQVGGWYRGFAAGIHWAEQQRR